MLGFILPNDIRLTLGKLSHYCFDRRPLLFFFFAEDKNGTRQRFAECPRFDTRQTHLCRVCLAEGRLGFAECPWHSGKRTVPVVQYGFVAAVISVCPILVVNDKFTISGNLPSQRSIHPTLHTSFFMVPYTRLYYCSKMTSIKRSNG